MKNTVLVKNPVKQGLKRAAYMVLEYMCDKS